EVELGCPVRRETSGELSPALIHDARGAITIARGEQLAWNVGEVFAVFRETQTADQFQIDGEIIIGFSESCIGVEHIRILAQKIVVAFVVETANRIGIDIRTCRSWRAGAQNGICVLISSPAILRTKTFMIVRNAIYPGQVAIRICVSR